MGGRRPAGRGAGTAITVTSLVDRYGNHLAAPVTVRRGEIAKLDWPPNMGVSTAPLGDIVPTDSRALAVQERTLQLFGSTVSTDTVVVQRNARGLSRERGANLASPPSVRGGPGMPRACAPPSRSSTCRSRGCAGPSATRRR